ncbi:MAG: XrtA/PEP-CTERM system TPR-repeat protein PrsT [Pseudomonadota bacterium]
MVQTRKILGIFCISILCAGSLVACNKSQAPETLMAEAIQHRQKGDTKAAIIQLKNVLQKNPDNVEARYLLGSIYNETGDVQSAEKEIRKALSLGMNPAKALPELGRALLGQGQYQKVLDEIKQPATPNAEISTLVGRAYLGLGMNREAKESLEQALQIRANEPDALIGLAKLALANNNASEALGLAEQAVTKNPDNIDASLFQGDLLRGQGQADAALAAYDHALKIKPDNAAAFIAKASLEIGIRKFDAAKADIDAARKLMPKNLLVVYTQALLDFNQGKNAAALESLQQVLRVAPDHMPSVLLAAAVQLALGSTEQAEQHLKKYLSSNPQNTYARKLLATALLQDDQPQRALDALAPILKDNQQDPQLLSLAGQSYMKAKNFAKATEYFEKASALSPQTAMLRTAVGLSKLEQGDNARAIAELEKAAGLDSSSPQAGILLVMTHLRLKEFDQALAAVLALEKDQPDNPLVQNLKGGVYLAKNNVSDARASFQKALSLQPDYFPAAVNLAQLDLQEKKPEVAKKRFEDILAKDKKNVQAMTALGKLADTEGKKTEATNWLERASNENPDALQPAMLLATRYLSLGEKQKSLNLVRKLQISHPTSPEVLDLLAQIYIANDDKAAALESYSKLAGLLPGSAAVQLRMAAVYMAMQNESAAADALKKALTLQPDYLDAQLAQLNLDVRKGNYDKALALARQMQKQQTKSAIAYMVEGDVQMAQNKPALAIKPYEQAYALSKNGPLLIKLHMALTRAGREKEASTRILQWLKDNPADAPARLYLANSYLAKKQFNEAVEQLKIMLQQNPQSVPVLNNLAWAYHQEKNPLALEYAEKAYQLAAENPTILDTLGWILLEQGNTARSLPLLQKASTLAPQSAEIRYHFAVGLVNSGDKANARKELERVVATEKTDSMTVAQARELLKKIQ